MNKILKDIRYKLRWIDPFTYSDIFLEKIGKKDDTAISWIVYIVTAFLSALLLYNILGLLFWSPSPMVIVVSGSMEPGFYRGDVMVLSGWNLAELDAPEVELPFPVAGRDISGYAETRCSVKGLAELIPCSCLSSGSNLSGECSMLLSGSGFTVLQSKDILTQEIFFPSINKTIEVKKEGDVVVYGSNTQGIPVIHRVIVKIRAEDGLFVLTKGDSELNAFIDQENSDLYKGAVPVEELHGRTIFMFPLIGYVKLILLDDIPCFIASLFTGQQCRFP